MKNTRLFWQIFLTALLIIVISIAATTWFGTQMIRSFYYQQMENDIRDRALLLRPNINQFISGSSDNLQDFCRQTGRAATTRITVISGSGKVLADSDEDPGQMDNHRARPEIKTAVTGMVGASLRFSNTLNRNMLYVAIPLHGSQPEAGVLRLSVPATAIETILSSIHRKILFGALLIALLAGGLSWYLARRISRPLEEMRYGAEQLAGGKTGHPIIKPDAHASREMAELAQSLNHMAEQINNRMNTIIQQRNELKAVFSSMTDGVLAIGTDHNILHINRAAAELFQLHDQDMQETPFEGVIRNLDLQQYLRKSLHSESAAEQELTLMENDRQMTLRVHAVPLFNGEGAKIGSLVVMNNLTRINELENIRQNFVANVSHELKTPITAIRGYVETLLDGAMDDPRENRNFLNIIHRQGARLDAIIDDLLTLARVEDRAGKDNIRMQEENIRAILITAKQACNAQGEQKNITVVIECNANLTALLSRPMMEQAIINLLTNAITSSPKTTTVTLRAEKTASADGTKFIRISIKDQGTGIAPEHQQRIFERFYRCDKARSRQQGGTGLGLAIVKHIAEAHNGTVELQSMPGKGSTFSIVLPVLKVRSKIT